MAEVIRVPQSLIPSSHNVENYTGSGTASTMGQLLINSTIVALAVSIGKIAISILSGFAIVFSTSGEAGRLRLIFITLMLPVPGPDHLHLPGGELPRLGGHLRGAHDPAHRSATATFLFRQFYLTIPDQMVDAARSTARGRCGPLVDPPAELRGEHRWRFSSSCSSTDGTSTSGRSMVIQLLENYRVRRHGIAQPSPPGRSPRVETSSWRPR